MGFFDRFKAPAATPDDPNATRQTQAGENWHQMTPEEVQAAGGLPYPDALPPNSPYRRTTTQPAGANDSGMTGGGGDPNFDIAGYVRQRQQQLPPTYDSMMQIYNELKAKGINVQIPTHAGGTQGSRDKFVLPDNSVIDMINSVDGPGASWSYNQDGYWVNGQPSSRPDVVAQDPNDFGGMGFSQTGVNGLASFDAPGINKPFTEQFSFNPDDIKNSEVYQFARDEGLNAVNRGHAAAGTFNTGGALKDLMKYASGNAAQAYGDEFNRRYGVYAGNKDTYFRNADSTFNRLNSLAQYGSQAAGKYADSVSSIYGQQGNVNATRAGNPPWWANGVNTGIAAGADALFNRK